ncbi:unnamed protein product [Rotaria sordida]|uniref:Uncharacterized protein n=1 Tax=Rotaria sordida TaxID=392033 RepID=A0A814HXS6_9BILA|nr:unnamed protein product [Rotaria sordida]CAF1016094.1 unnamed protein product [Rotaria sordida]CAF3956812.1 unnamed protein product [Rotaria sordida]CAF4176216.1 unnamed protein product [Rotaria sordida]
MGKLDGKVALITGGSDGIGLATVRRFVAEGAEHVFITGRRQQMLDNAIKTIGSKNVTAVQGDVSNMADLDRLYNVIKENTGRLDILFANAGIVVPGPIGSITEKEFDDSFNINVKGVLFTVQKVLPILVDGASVILNASVTSTKGLPDRSVYSATKAAIRSFARCWTVDLKDHRIRVNAISPGTIETNMPRKDVLNEEEKKAFFAKRAAATPMNRLGTPDEVAQAVVFLASDDSSYITGIELFVDGGWAQI